MRAAAAAAARTLHAAARHRHGYRVSRLGSRVSRLARSLIQPAIAKAMHHVLQFFFKATSRCQVCSN
jgi:hypothetical protein